jgi:pimeloyl-ACP methyl ester carboxylesterase
MSYQTTLRHEGTPFNRVADAPRMRRHAQAPLPAALNGDYLSFATDLGRVHAYVAGRGRPLLLIHSINAAASAAEVRPLHDWLQRSRQVISIDLPGFGLSERSDSRYTPKMMTRAIQAVVAAIASYQPGPIDALALSLSSEFLARAAVETPSAYRSLAFVSPTGFSGHSALREAPGTTRGSAMLYALLRRPGWGPAIFRFMTRPAMIRRFLRATWGSADIDKQLWRYDTWTTRQAGAAFAPLYFMSGQLFSADIHRVYEQLTMPVWSSHGVRGAFTDYRQEHIVKSRQNWSFSTFQTGAFPHFEVTPEFVADYEHFLSNGSPVSTRAVSRARHS